jgi:DnaJ-class molecular chaperone
MGKNYYLILGVSSDASLEEIKTAFRRRAMESHPDRTGRENEPFIEVQEAYGVLSDPDRRQKYDRHTLSRDRRRPWGPVVEQLVPKGPAPEPFRAVTPATGIHDLGFDRTLAEFHPSFEELFDRLWNNFESLTRPKAEHLESLTVEVVIGPQDARFGGQVRVQIPARATCPSCGGRGAVGPFVCWRCDGRGALTAEYPLEIPYPPGVRDGHAVRIPLAHYCIENFYLTVLFRVSGEW